MYNEFSISLRKFLLKEGKLHQAQEKFNSFASNHLKYDCYFRY